MTAPRLFALALLLPLGLPVTTFAQASDFCRSTCFSEKNSCRKNAEQQRSESGGSAAAAASLALALSARPPHQAVAQAGNNADFQASSSLQGRRDEQAALRNEGYAACDTRYTQCVEDCRR